MPTGEAADFAAATQLLTACGYPELAGASDAALEQAFVSRREAVLNEMERFTPEKNLVLAFRLKYDYHNAKVLVKSETAEQDAARLLSACGRVAPQVLTEAFYGDSWEKIPSPLAAAIRQAKTTLARTGDPQMSDMGLDQAYFAELLALTGTLSTGFYTGYVRLSIDVANLRSAVRCVRGGMNEAVLKASLIEGGTVSRDRILRSAYGDGVTGLFTDRAMQACAELGQRSIEGAPLAAFERACDDALMRYLTGAKLVAYGPDVAVAYLAALEGEIVAVRMVLLGKRSGLSADALRERLRDSYE